MILYTMLAQNCPKGKRQLLNLSNFLFPDGRHRTGGSNCEMFEITWQVLTLKSSKLLNALVLFSLITSEIFPLAQ